MTPEDLAEAGADLTAARETLRAVGIVLASIAATMGTALQADHKAAKAARAKAPRRQKAARKRVGAARGG